MKRNTVLNGIVCLAVCLLGAPGMAQASGMIGPELRQWIKDPAQGLAAMRERRIPYPLGILRPESQIGTRVGPNLGQSRPNWLKETVITESAYYVIYCTGMTYDTAHLQLA